MLIFRSSYRRCSVEKLFLEISQNSQENTYARVSFLIKLQDSGLLFCKKDFLQNFVKFAGKHLCQYLFFNKVADLRAATLLKKRLGHLCFPVNFAKFLKTTFYRTPLGNCFWFVNNSYAVSKFYFRNNFLFNIILPKRLTTTKWNYRILIPCTVITLLIFFWNSCSSFEDFKTIQWHR